ASKVTWQHDLNANQHVAAAGYLAQGGRAASIETGTQLYISNLDYGVSNDDIKLAEDLGALPIWVFNAGFDLNDEIDTSSIESYVQDALDGIEFARGSPTSQWN
ncbi:Alpha-L-arabinofuranosidase 1, partial [Glycine soja]